MNYSLILNRRLLCLILAGLFSSYLAAARPGFSGKAGAEGSLRDLNITPFGSVRSWCRIADPLGKTISYKDFNANSSSDSSDIGIFWWETRDIQKIEVVYDPKPAGELIGAAFIQYWQQS